MAESVAQIPEAGKNSFECFVLIFKFAENRKGVYAFSFFEINLMMKKLLFILLMFAGPLHSVAQESESFPERLQNSEGIGSIEIRQEAGIDILYKKYYTNNEKLDGIDCWSVLLYQGLDREEAFKADLEFSEQYPDMQHEVVYVAPDFKTLAGIFFTKVDAFKNLRKIQGKFRHAYLVKHRIRIENIRKDSLPGQSLEQILP